jgi:hypothetical protein
MIYDHGDIEVSNPEDSRCGECGCSYGVHLVICAHFHCHVCGWTGKSANHHGGCPQSKGSLNYKETVA